MTGVGLAPGTPWSDPGPAGSSCSCRCERSTLDIGSDISLSLSCLGLRTCRTAGPRVLAHPGAVCSSRLVRRWNQWRARSGGGASSTPRLAAACAPRRTARATSCRNVKQPGRMADVDDVLQSHLSSDAELALNGLLAVITRELGLQRRSDRDGWHDTVRHQRHRYLDRLRALACLRSELDRLIDAEGTSAVTVGATFAEAGEAAGFTRQRAHQRFERHTAARVSPRATPRL